MAAPAVWPAPAKLNLFLQIIGRRPDGHHLLQTVFQFLDYCDELRFSLRDDGVITRTNPVDSIAPAQDLSLRAAKRLQQAAGIRMGVDIHLTKRLPIGGGLGGGSSDAATVLIALNRLWRCGLSGEELGSLGLELGADVPVFLHGHAAWGEGVGERLQSVVLPEPWYVVIKPPIEISTGAVFAAPELTRNYAPITITDFLSRGGENACEAVVRRRYPEVARALDWLSNFSAARLTGTGSCVFAPVSTRMIAESIVERLPRGWLGFIAKGLNRSPAHAAAASEALA